MFDIPRVLTSSKQVTVATAASYSFAVHVLPYVKIFSLSAPTMQAVDRLAYPCARTLDCICCDGCSLQKQGIMNLKAQFELRSRAENMYLRYDLIIIKRVLWFEGCPCFLWTKNSFWSETSYTFSATFCGPPWQRWRNLAVRSMRWNYERHMRSRWNEKNEQGRYDTGIRIAHKWVLYDMIPFEVWDWCLLRVVQVYAATKASTLTRFV